jgi:hypothetical protein
VLVRLEYAACVALTNPMLEVVVDKFYFGFRNNSLGKTLRPFDRKGLGPG